MAKKKFLILLVIAIIVATTIAVSAGAVCLNMCLQMEDFYPSASILLPLAFAYIVYRLLKRDFDATLGLTIGITLAILSFLIIGLVESLGRYAPALIEAVCWGLIIISLEALIIYKIFEKHFENYKDLD